MLIEQSTEPQAEQFATGLYDVVSQWGRLNITGEGEHAYGRVWKTYFELPDEITNGLTIATEPIEDAQVRAYYPVGNVLHNHTPPSLEVTWSTERREPVQGWYTAAWHAFGIEAEENGNHAIEGIEGGDLEIPSAVRTLRRAVGFTERVSKDEPFPEPGEQSPGLNLNTFALMETRQRLREQALAGPDTGVRFNEANVLNGLVRSMSKRDMNIKWHQAYVRTWPDVTY